MFAGPAVAAPGDLRFKLTSPDPHFVPSFGDDLAVVDGDILVGEPQWAPPGTRDVGRAHLFDGQTGALRFTFNDPDPTATRGTFGRSLAAGDGSVFVGRAGRVYAFDQATGDLRFQIDELSDGNSSFGSALAYSNGGLLVAEPSFTTGGLISVGRAHLFHADTGQLDLTIPNPEPAGREGFSIGNSLAVFGNKLAVGSFADNDFAGRVWVFDRSSGERLFALDNPNPEAQTADWFSWSVAASEELIVVGANEDTTSGLKGSGTVYVFDAVTGGLKHTLFSPRSVVEGEFGRQVAITPAGDVLVGAYGESVEGILGAGRAYLFDGETGNLYLDIANPEPEVGAFGWSVAATDSAIVIGSGAGQAVYVFEAIPEPSSFVLGATLIVVALGVAVVRRWRNLCHEQKVMAVRGSVRLCAVLIAALATNSAAAAPGDLLFTLTSPDPQLVPSFGDALAVVDGDILVGEPQWAPPGTRDVGRAHLFDGQTGALRFTFDEPEPEGNRITFGQSVAGGDGSIFIGRRGRVHVYDAITGQPRFLIEPPDDDGDSFASHMTYGNGSLLISEPSFDTGGLEGISVGRAHLYDAASGQMRFTLPNPEPGRQEAFSLGYSLAIFGDKLAVGSFPDNDFAGRVWVFDRSSGETRFTLENPHPESPPPHFLADWFGWSVAANEELIVVGADEDETDGIDSSGTVYVFDAVTGALRHTLFSPRSQIDGEFGRMVALTPDGDVLVGAYGEIVNSVMNAGRAYLFDGETGGLLLEFANPEGGIGTFGWTVAATESQILIGAPASQTVYVYQTIPEPSALILCATVLVVALAVGTIRKWRKGQVPRYCLGCRFASFAPWRETNNSRKVIM
jgi:outer membrane protein assembly factor BamB